MHIINMSYTTIVIKTNDANLMRETGMPRTRAMWRLLAHAGKQQCTLRNVVRKTDSVHHHHHPEGVVYRSLRLDSNTVAVSEMAPLDITRPLEALQEGAREEPRGDQAHQAARGEGEGSRA